MNGLEAIVYLRHMYRQSAPIVVGQHGMASARSKTGDPKCSQAASEWARRQATAETHKQLAKCRAEVRGKGQASALRNAGQEAKAQHIEHRLASGEPITAKERKAKAAELRKARAPKPKPVVATKPKPSYEDRLNLLISKAGGIRREREAEGKMSAADAAQARKVKLQAKLDEVKGKDQGGFSLKARGSTSQFGNEGKGKTGSLFEEMRGAGGRDLPGQTTFLDKPKPEPTLEPEGEPLHLGVESAVPLDVAKRKSLADKIRAMRKRAGIGVDPASHTNHAPGSVTPLDTSLISFDPNRFQYKLDQTDTKTGSVGSLAGVKKWDPELAGTISVWKDPADGKTYVVNGHNRLDLAKKLGVGRIDVKFLKARDATEARAKGALTNIAEGRGSVLDAAKFFRDSGITNKADLEDRGIPLREDKARQGLELAGLANPLFRRVIDGTMTPGRGAVIGGSGLSHDQQMKVAQLAESKRVAGHEITDSHLREVVDEVKHAPTKSSGGGSLFGDDPEEESLALHRAALTSHIKDRLSREKRLFGTVARKRSAEELSRAGNVINQEESGKISSAASEALGTFDALKRSAGPVSRALNRATERLADAKSPSARKAIQDKLYEEILDAVQRSGDLAA